MKHTIHNIEGFDVIAFDDSMTNYGDGRLGDASHAIEWANENKIGGHNDWVLPIKEVIAALHGLADGALGTRFTWSSSPYVGDASGAWYVCFEDGYVSYEYRYSSYVAVCLVRSSQCLDIGIAGLKKALTKKV